MGNRDEALGKPFAVETEHADGTLTIRLSGAFGAECKQHFEQQLQAVEEPRPERVLLDLRGLTFIDSAALAAILTTDADLREQGLQVAVIRGKGQVRRVFEMTGVERALTAVDDPADLSTL
jgi:anti-anti-sigma factor